MICGRFRRSRMQNFLRRPTMVADILRKRRKGGGGGGGGGDKGMKGWREGEGRGEGREWKKREGGRGG